MEFVKLSQFSESELLNTHNLAFSDYEVPMELSLEDFTYFNKRRGVRYDLSIGAVEGNKLIGFILNAIDMWKDKLTCYDCGTGVIPEFRQKGVGNQIFSKLLPLLRKEGVNQYQLEVIQTNTAAFNLYKNRNFQIIRELDCLQVEKDQLTKELVKDKNKTQRMEFDIKELKNIDWEKVKQFWDFQPSWQNSDLSIERVKESFYYFGAYLGNEIIGYMVCEPNGGITQIAVNPKYRKKHIGENLLHMMLENNPNVKRINIINVDTRDETLLTFLRNLGFKSFVTQYEMSLLL
ncbi:MAG: GNAT family N-acetyltransferase [Promethearchaeota archaeon]